MSDETYNGWANRETWAVVLHINNDQGWQESVHEALRTAQYEPPMFPDITDADAHKARQAGEIIRGNVEELFEADRIYDVGRYSRTRLVALVGARDDIGSLWRVDWTELGAAFLSDLDES